MKFQDSSMHDSKKVGGVCKTCDRRWGRIINQKLYALNFFNVKGINRQKNIHQRR